jgi:hypothetical protein
MLRLKVIWNISVILQAIIFFQKFTGKKPSKNKNDYTIYFLF